MSSQKYPSPHAYTKGDGAAVCINVGLLRETSEQESGHAVPLMLRKAVLRAAKTTTTTPQERAVSTVQLYEYLVSRDSIQTWLIVSGPCQLYRLLGFGDISNARIALRLCRRSFEGMLLLELKCVEV